MNSSLDLLDPILNDELYSAREAFGRAIAQKVAEISSTGNRFSTALLNILETLAKEELRRRAAAILACSTKLTPSSLISLRLDDLVSWAQGHLSREKADIEAAIAGVSMGNIERHPDFLDEVARTSASRLVAEISALFRTASSSELDVAAEAPDFVRKAKWIITKGRRNWRWLALGLLLLLVLAVAPRLLPPEVASIVGLESEASLTPTTALRTVWEQNWLTVNDPVPWMSSSDGTSATNREQLLILLDSLDLGSTPAISSLRGKIVKSLRSATSRPEDPVYNVQVSPEIRSDLQSLRRAIRNEAVAVGVTVKDGQGADVAPPAVAPAESVVHETAKPTTDCLHRLPGTYARTREAAPDATVELFNERAVVRWHGSPPKTATFEHIGNCRWMEVNGPRWFELRRTVDALKWGHGAEWRKHWQG